jgi:chemosensory pili system protein ChpC
MTSTRTMIHSQLITTQSRSLLLPNTAIAEIVHYAAPQPVDDAPDWLLGTMVWRGLRIPVVSYERASGDVSMEYDNRARIAVLNGVHSGAALQFYAFVISNNPRLLKVSRDDVRKQGGGDRDKFQLQQVVVNNITAIIQTERVH